VAKAFGIRVLTFSVGFGKRLFGIKKGDTDYRLSLIPLGGYVKMAGENLDEAVTGADYEFMSKPKWQRFCVAVAGPAMNILTALAIPAILAMAHYEVPAYRNQTPVVNTVVSESPAETAGLQRGDVILAVDGRPTPMWRDVEDAVMINPDREVPVVIRRAGQEKTVTLRVGSLMFGSEKVGEAGLTAYPGPNAKVMLRSINPGSPASEAGLESRDQILAVDGKPVQPAANPAEEPAGTNAIYSSLDVIRLIQTSGGKPVVFTVRRGGETLDITTTPRVEEGGKARIGAGIVLADAEIVVTRLGPLEAIKHSIDENGRIIMLTQQVLAQMFVGQRSARDVVTGPVGIAAIVGQAAEEGAVPVFQLMGLLSLNLGIFNLLPIPVLDGGLIFMLALEAVLGLFGLTLSLRVKERMMQVGMVMLMLLMGFVIFNDISKRFGGGVSQTPQVEQPQK
jgi:regulator of sigma E protease